MFAPAKPDSECSDRVTRWSESSGVDAEHAVLRTVLAEASDACDEVRQLLAAASGDALADDPGASPWVRELGRRLLR